ncbi:MAG: NADPH-dependent oxidoreductase [Candidatus Zixiibacteriota bacterium]
MNDALQLLKDHVSVRQFTDQDISPEQEQEIVETSRRSPTSSNLQTYSIISARNAETKRSLAELCGGQSHIEKCPLFLVFVADLYRLHAVAKRKGYPFQGDYTEFCLVATVDASLVAGRALMAAQALGLGGVMVGAIRNNPDEVCALLSLPEYVYPMMGMSLGYPAKLPQPKPRIPIEGVWYHERYDDSSHEKALAEYDATIVKGGHLAGREVEAELYPAFEGVYSWSEHSARRMASTSPTSCRPSMLEFLRSRGLMRR